MLILRHTPDACWTASGWHPAKVDQRKKVEIEFSVEDRQPSRAFLVETNDAFVGQRSEKILVPFSCLIFEAPSGGARELAVWCTLLGGKPVDLGEDWRKETDAVEGGSHPFRNQQLRFKQLYRAVAERLPMKKSKEFIRYSVPAGNDLESSLEQIKAFGPLWLWPGTNTSAN